MSVGVALAALLIGSTVATSSPAAQTARWSEPNIDSWFYLYGGSVGTRRQGPTFGNLVVESGVFVQGTNTDPTRYGMSLFAFETYPEIEAGRDPSEYVIESIKMTAMIEDGTSDTQALVYEPNAKTQADYLSEYASGSPSTAQPMELFGVGFSGDVEGFALGPEQTGERFSEDTFPYDGGYIGYPVAGDSENGGYVDVSNNISGGYSATAAGNLTGPFDAVPWAIGSTNLNAGEDVPDLTTFTFDLDLDLPGVRSYIQQSLADGAIGFMLSSLHSTEQFGEGDAPYPQWLMKDALTGLNPVEGAEAATLEIVFSFADDNIAGDFDGSGYVDQLDFEKWKQDFGSTVVTAGTGADGNGDGSVMLADYTVWRDHVGSGTPPEAFAGSTFAVPEPTGARLVGILAITVSFCGWVNWFIRPKESRRNGT